jgi:purine-nucleoside phosphorylase
MVESLFLKTVEVREAINFIRKATNFRPKLGLILGSGLGNFGNRIEAISTISSCEIPHYPSSSVQGHTGKLIFGYLQKDKFHSVPLLVFQGRVHFYETGSLEKVVFPIFFSHQLGIKKLIFTNAAGGINSCFNVGDLMLIQDILTHAILQLPTISGKSKVPQRKTLDYFDTRMKNLVIHCASQIKIPIQQGTYCWLSGPSYETPAEIRMLKRIGADVVGMSTVPESFLAHSLGMETVGISLISNLAAGISSSKLSHANVSETGTKVSKRFSELIEQLVLSFNQ